MNIVGGSRQLLVSVHDVTPAHERQIRRVFDLLAEFGVRRYALFVVPNWHGAWPLDRYPEFAEELRRRQAAGAEIFLHGLRHDEVGLKRSFVQQIRAAGRTAREGEFLSLSPRDAAQRIDQGLEMLHACGLRPVGFVPPAWLQRQGTLQILRERNLAITEGPWAITDTSSGRRVRAPAVEWSTLNAWRRAAGVVIAAVRRQVERPRRLIRLAIHPSDITVPYVARSVEVTLEALLRTREAASYQKVLGGP